MNQDVKLLEDKGAQASESARTSQSREQDVCTTRPTAERGHGEPASGHRRAKEDQY